MSEPRRPFSSQSRPIAVQAATAVERWSLPEVGGPVIGRHRDDKNSSPSTVDVLREALQESEARGYQAGLAKAQAEGQLSIDALSAQVKQLDSILALLAQPLSQLDSEVEYELLHLTLAVG